MLRCKGHVFDGEDLTSFSAGKSGSPMTSFEYRAVQAAGKSS